MSLEKSKLRAQVAHDLGVSFDDKLEAAKTEVVRWEGANQGLVQGQKALEALFAHVDKDVEEGKYDLVTAEVAKLYVKRATAMLATLAQQAGNTRLQSIGRMMAAEESVKVIKKMYDEELAKAEAIERGETEVLGAPLGLEGRRGRPTGIRPAISIKEQRLAEEKAAAEPAAAVESSAEPPGPATKPKRKTRARNP